MGGGRQLYIYTIRCWEFASAFSPFPLLLSFSFSPLPPLPPLRIDDELLEVIGLYSFLHVGKIQVSLAEPLRLGQASEIKVLSQCGGGVAALCL